MLLFLEKIKYPRAFDLLLMVLSPMHPEKNFNPEISDTIWKTMKNIDFFEMMGTKLLFGHRVSEKYFKVQPKPADKTVLKYGNTESRNAAFEPVPILTVGDREERILLEEKAGLKFDIDGIMGLLDYLKNNSHVLLQDSESHGSINEEPLEEDETALALDYNRFPSPRRSNEPDFPGSSEKIKSSPKNRAGLSSPKKADNGGFTHQMSTASFKMEGPRSKKHKFAKLVDKRIEHLVDYERLAQYYPFEKTFFDPSDVDMVAADLDTADCDKQTEAVVVDLVRQLVIQLMFFNKKDGSSIPKFLEDKSMNVNSLVSSMLDFGDGGVFKMLLFNYLSKLPSEIDCPEQPALTAGMVVNRLVDISQQVNGFVVVYNKTFNRLLVANVESMCKFIINFAVIGHRLRNVYLETLLTTFYLTAKTNHRSNYAMLDYIMPTVWDCVLDVLLNSG